MTTRLRPHHLLCTLTFAGKGYTPAFIRNFEGVVRRIAAGCEIIEVVEGPDDICAALLTETDCHCRNASVMTRDRHAADALSNLLQQPIHAGEQLLLDRKRLYALRKAFAAGTIRQACSGCQWKPLCDAIARDSFKETWLVRLENPAEPCAASGPTAAPDTSEPA